MSASISALNTIVILRKNISLDTFDLSELPYPWNIVVEISFMILFICISFSLIKMIKNIFSETEV